MKRQISRSGRIQIWDRVTMSDSGKDFLYCFEDGWSGKMTRICSDRPQGAIKVGSILESKSSPIKHLENFRPFVILAPLSQGLPICRPDGLHVCPARNEKKCHVFI